MDPIEELEKFTFEMIAKQELLLDKAKQEKKSLQHIGEIYSVQLCMKIIHTRILQIKNRGKHDGTISVIDATDPEDEIERQMTFD